MTAYDEEAVAALRRQAIRVRELAIRTRNLARDLRIAGHQPTQLPTGAGTAPFVIHVSGGLVRASDALAEQVSAIESVANAYDARAHVIQFGGGATDG